MKTEPKSMKEAVFGAMGKTPPNENGLTPKAPAPPADPGVAAGNPPAEPKGVKSRLDKALSLLQQAQDLLGEDVDLSDDIESAKALDIDSE
jgi:hypothetical protein